MMSALQTAPKPPPPPFAAQVSCTVTSALTLLPDPFAAVQVAPLGWSIVTA
jgi:hypothetical protein